MSFRACRGPSQQETPSRHRITRQAPITEIPRILGACVHRSNIGLTNIDPLIIASRWIVLAALFFPLATATAGSFDAENSAEIRVIRSQVRAAQFLSYATFGPDMDSINELAIRIRQIGTRAACDEWIDQQFQIPASYHQETIDRMLADHGYTNTDGRIWLQRYRYHAFWHNAIDAPDQLRQRTAWALSQIFVVNDEDSNFGDATLDSRGYPHWYGPTAYYDMLVRNSFGNYRQLLGDVTLHPVMGIFLSHLRNAKADPASGVYPDENYAREVMQLFSIGLYELLRDGRAKRNDAGELIPTYDNDVIRNMARVFTGLTFPDSDYFGYGDSRDFQRPMEMWEDYHDTEQKTIVGGLILPAHDGTPGKGMQDINATLDHLADHPNVGPFIARRMIQRLVRSNPSRAYINRVAAAFNGDTGSAPRGDMKALVKAVLLDPEAFRGVRGIRQADPLRWTVVERGTEFGRLREPVLRYTAMIRALRSGEVLYNGQNSPWYVIPRMEWEFGQAPFASPSVFNFYLPDYQPPGPLSQVAASRRLPNSTLFAPEFQVLTPVINNRTANRLRWEIYEGQIRNQVGYVDGQPLVSTIKFDYQRELELIVDDPQAMMDRLDLLLCNGTMDQATKENIPAIIEEVFTERPWLDERERFMGALNAVILSPSCVITQ
tara:strand:+ start:71861 stop:73846 length:1986 start_codon:yes stop_codon:yes gene_type:complete